jgi:hypothetical protein
MTAAWEPYFRTAAGRRSAIVAEPAPVAEGDSTVAVSIAGKAISANGD